MDLDFETQKIFSLRASARAFMRLVEGFPFDVVDIEDGDPSERFYFLYSIKKCPETPQVVVRYTEANLKVEMAGDFAEFKVRLKSECFRWNRYQQIVGQMWCTPRIIEDENLELLKREVVNAINMRWDILNRVAEEILDRKVISKVDFCLIYGTELENQQREKRMMDIW